MLKVKQEKKIISTLYKINLCFFILFSFVFFNSCAWTEQQEKGSLTNLSSKGCGNSQAPFIVDQVVQSSNNEAVSVIHGEDGLAKTFTLNLKTCMWDYSRKDNTIQNIPFVIEYYSSEENKQKGKPSKITAISNTQGCIQWQEEYNYKYTVKPLWIGLERTIKREKGAYTGSETIPMAVNPWLSDRDRKAGLPDILDIRCDYSRNHHVLAKSEDYEANGLKYLLETKKEERPLLWIPDVDVQIHEDTKGQEDVKEQISEKSQRSAQEQKDTNSHEDTEEKRIRQLLSQYQNPCMSNQSSHFNCYQRQVEMRVYVPLKLRTVDKSGGVREDDLLGGSYNIETALIISPKGHKNNYRLHENKCYRKNLKISQTNKSLSFSCRLNFSYFSQNALYKLVIRVKPSSEDLPFKKFEGVYSINLNFEDEKLNPTIDTGYDKNYARVLATSEELEIIENMKIQSLLSLLKPSENLVKLEEIGKDKSQRGEGPIKGSSFDRLHLDGYGEYKESDESSSFYRLHLDGYGEYKLSHVETGGPECSERENVVERTVVFVGKLCLTDVLSSQKLNNTPFRVFLEKPREGIIKEIYEDGKKELFKTDGRSCISVPIKIEHKIYNRQKYFQVDMHVLSEKLNLYGKVRLALSPWQRAFQAFQDAQNLPEDYIRFDTKNIPKPQLIINQFRSINLFPSYGLDKLLNIHLFHRIYLLFQPFIRRPDNLSLGLDYRARELLRDGPYLVRVLVLRNPQETGDTGAWSRIQTTDKLFQIREDKVTDEFISLKGAQYITHTDTVVKAQANFINFYMPLFLSTKQFFYVASRNFIVVEIHPADPSGFVYKEDCSIDLQKTDWRAFRDHELKNAPYVGAYNIQHWVNWNLLQPVEGLNTDQIIEQSEIGREYKHFNLFSSNSKVKSLQKTVSVDQACVSEIPESRKREVEKTLSLSEDGDIVHSLDPSEQEVDGCVKDDIQPSAGLTIYRQEEEKYFTSNVLENFSKDNSLKQVILSGESGDTFIKDIQASFDKYLTSDSFENLNEDFKDTSMLKVLNNLSIEDKNLLEFRIKKMCDSVSCYSEVIKAYLTSRISDKDSSPLQFIVGLINDNTLLFDEDRALLNVSLQECEDTGSCLSITKTSILNVLDSGINRLSFYEQNLFLENLMLFFSKNQKQKLFEQIEEQCFPWFQSFVKNLEDYRECYYNNFRLFYEKINFPQFSDFLNYANQLRVGLLKEVGLQKLNVSDMKHEGFVKSFMSKPTEDGLLRLIETGIKSDNRYASSTLSFTRPLCFFWFDHYLKNYLGQDQMIGAYTNYLRKFDYHQILDNGHSKDQEYSHALSFYPNIIKYLAMQDNEQSASCYERYTECLLVDHCQERSVNQSKGKLCSQLSIQDNTCVKELKNACQKDPSLSLCSDECLFNSDNPHCGRQHSCNRAVRDFCLVNPDQNICAKYENRCFSHYLPCLKETTSVFKADSALNYDGEDKSFEPLKTCLNNPYDFFQFENKMIVHELSKQGHRYLGGFLETFNVAANYSIGSYMNWTAQRGRSLSASSDLSSGGNIGSVFKPTRVLSLIGLSAKLGGSQSIGSNESNSGRRAIDNRTGESVYFTVGSARFEVGVKKFQNCLVIKPRPHSFTSKPTEGEKESVKRVWSQSASALKKIIVSRPGLILCSPTEDRGDKAPKYITESYYYVSQMMDASNSQFLNLYDLANRPFMLILRGRKEFVKLYHILKMTIDGDNGAIEENGGVNLIPENMFIEYPFPVEEAVGLNLTIREFNETGFSPGVYHYPYDSDEILDAWFANKEHENNLFMKFLSEYNLFDLPTPANQSIPVQQE